ncbi:MAG: class I SAM-dependent methyltransferase [Desulfosalsimonadaceae bacterium]
MTFYDTISSCPLCRTADTQFYDADKFRIYRLCPCCSLVFVPKAWHLSTQQEKARYNTHNNDPRDPGYRKFLRRLFDPLRARLPEGAQGLDFGCGPGPALAAMFCEAGFSVNLYDKFYAPDQQAFNRVYDFIMAAEVLEHLSRPDQELSRLFSVLRDGGILGVMTKLVQNREAFANWHYKRDPTHISFFSRQTFLWLAATFDANVEFIPDTVILLQKKPQMAQTPGGCA